MFLVPPSAPNMFKVSRLGVDDVTLNWYPPISDGGADISQYILFKKKALTGPWEEVGTVSGFATSFTVPKLMQGKPHYIGICAVNSAGRSEIVDLSRPVIPERPKSKSCYCVTSFDELSMHENFVMQSNLIHSLSLCAILSCMMIIFFCEQNDHLNQKDH